jgi:hypothetical protein
MPGVIGEEKQTRDKKVDGVNKYEEEARWW